MLSEDSKGYPVSKVIVGVLILVVMDDALGDPFSKWLPGQRLCVLILVVMDDALGEHGV